MGVYKKGENWYIDYYFRGRRKRRKIGPSKKLAEQVLKDVQVKIAKGEYLGVFKYRQRNMPGQGCYCFRREKVYLQSAKRPGE